VSIKNKLVTAVTTAGLLAGLFGSAFVPAAYAVTPKATYTEVYVGGAVSPQNLVKTIGFESATSHQDGADDDAWVGLMLFSESEKFADEPTEGLTGTRYGRTAYVPETLSAVSSNTAVKVAWGVADDGDVLGATDADADEGDEDNEVGCADLQNSLSPRGAVTAGNFAASDSIANAAGLANHGTGATQYPATVGREYVTAEGALDDLDFDNNGNDAQGVYILCLAAAEDDTAATSTITIKADGTTVATLTVTAVGPADSIVLATASRYVAADNDAVEMFVTAKVYDENDTLINGKSSSVSSVAVADIFAGGLEDWSDNPENGSEDSVDLFAGNTPVTASAEAEAELYEFDLEPGVCTSDEDDDMIGKSYSVKVQSDDADEIVSNAVTITCTEGGDDARVTKVTAEATTGGNPYEETGALDDGLIELTATVVAGNGGVLGDGSGVTCNDFDWSIEFASSDNIYSDDAAADGAVTAGECVLGYILPGDENDDGDAEDTDDELTRLGLFSYTVTAASPDLGDADADEADFALSYRATGTVDTVTIARVRNAAKTVATITFDGGESAAYESVYFQVEKANGAVAEFRRRANGDGIARLVLSRRNTTIYVYAFSETSDESDTIKVRFR
jgi:hypothetical protein